MVDLRARRFTNAHSTHWNWPKILKGQTSSYRIAAAAEAVSIRPHSEPQGEQEKNVGPAAQGPKWAGWQFFRAEPPGNILGHRASRCRRRLSNILHLSYLYRPRIAHPSG